MRGTQHTHTWSTQLNYVHTPHTQSAVQHKVRQFAQLVTARCDGDDHNEVGKLFECRQFLSNSCTLLRGRHRRRRRCRIHYCCHFFWCLRLLFIPARARSHQAIIITIEHRRSVPFIIVRTDCIAVFQLLRERIHMRRRSRDRTYSTRRCR